jgi:HEAT repeat protein
MYFYKVSRRLVVFSALLALVAWFYRAGPLWADAFPPDPVDALKQVLDSPPAEPKEFDAELQKAGGKLQNMGDLYRALNLQEWPQQPTEEPTPIEAVKLRQQALLAERLQQRISRTFKSGSVADQLAALTLVAEMGARISVPENPDARNLDKLSEGLTGVSAGASGGRRSIGRALTAPVVDLVRQGANERVRETAARTLGQMIPNPRLAVPALRSVLTSAPVGERRAAAAGLLSLVRVVSRRTVSPSLTTGEVKVEVDWADTCAQVVPAASAGLVDADAEVRRLCARAIEQTAAALMDQVTPQRTIGSVNEPEAKTPPRASAGELQPVMQALGAREAAVALARAALDSDAEVRILSRQALAEMGEVRDRLVHPEPSRTGSGAEGEEASQGSSPGKFIATAAGQLPQPRVDPFREALRIALPALRRGLSDPVVAARLQAVEALETLGPGAAPAVPELIRTLRDPDRFVRWAAARTLGKIGPGEAAVAVRPLGRLLHDHDLDVDLAAATALDRLGPAAHDAVPDLIRALGASDAEKRRATIRTLTSIGTAATPAVPGLGRALSDPEAGVRHDAAVLLGKLGPAAAAAEPALQRALADSDPDVRQAVSAALLKVSPPR